jgi:hypothetical protein
VCVGCGGWRSFIVEYELRIARPITLEKMDAAELDMLAPPSHATLTFPRKRLPGVGKHGGAGYPQWDGTAQTQCTHFS